LHQFNFDRNNQFYFSSKYVDLKSKMNEVQFVNHGVSSSLGEKVKVEIEEFFNLPMEEKKRFWPEPGDVQGFGQAFVVS